MNDDEDFFNEEIKPDEITFKKLDSLALDIFNQRSLCEQREEELKNENKRLEEMQKRMVHILERIGRTNHDLPGVGKIVVVEQSFVGLPHTPEEKEAFFTYLKDRGIFDDIITVNSRTLNSFYKREREIAREEGRSIEFNIPGIKPPTTRTAVRLLRGD